MSLIESGETGWRHRLLILQTTNHHRGIDTYTHAAKYPDAIALAAGILNTTGFPRSSDTSPQKANRPAQRPCCRPVQTG